MSSPWTCALCALAAAAGIACGDADGGTAAVAPSPGGPPSARGATERDASGSDTRASDAGASDAGDASPDGPRDPWLAEGGASDASGVDAAAGADAAPDAASLDPLHAALLDPARPSVPFECAGAPVSPGEVAAALFAPGTSQRCVARQGVFPESCGGELLGWQRRRSCAPLTGCSAFDAVAAAPFALQLHVDVQGQILVTFHDPSTGYGSSPRMPIGADGIVDFTASSRRTVARVRFARVANGTLCLSVATPAFEVAGPGGATVTTFTAAQGGVFGFHGGTSAPGDPPPTDAPAYGCTGASSRDADLAAAWFAPGAVKASFASKPRVHLEASRTCHPFTGCSAWSTRAPLSFTLTGLAVENGHVLVEALLPSPGMPIGTPTVVAHAGGAFGGTFGRAVASGFVSPQCASVRTGVVEPSIWGGADVELQTFTGERVDIR